MVTGQYPRNDAMRVFTLVSSDNKRKELILEYNDNIGCVFHSCEDILEESVACQEQDEEFDSCCKIAAMCAIVLLKKIVVKKTHDKIA